MNEDICFVLVETTHSGNIGAAARAMKTMGFSSLRLVNPCKYLTSDSLARASGADDIVKSAQVFDSLAAAIADCSLVYGTSARSRTLEWSTMNLDQAALEVAARGSAADSRAAVVFGRERSGLSNEELDLCQRRLSIPSNPAFSSLNLGSAVQVVAYEIGQALHQLGQRSAFGHIVSESADSVAQQGSAAVASLSPGMADPSRLEAENRLTPEMAQELGSNDELDRGFPKPRFFPKTSQADLARSEQGDRPVDSESMEHFYTHLERTMIVSGFLNPDNPRLLMRRLRRFFGRSEPRYSEMQILRGILSAFEKSMQRHEAGQPVSPPKPPITD